MGREKFCNFHTVCVYEQWNWIQFRTNVIWHWLKITWNRSFDRWSLWTVFSALKRFLLKSVWIFPWKWIHELTEIQRHFELYLNPFGFHMQTELSITLWHGIFVKSTRNLHCTLLHDLKWGLSMEKLQSFSSRGKFLVIF